MDVCITHNHSSDTGRAIEAVYGKKTVSAYLPHGGPFVAVMQHNASHKAGRMMGRTFPSLAEALEAFKSAELRSFIADIQRGAFDAPDMQTGPR